MFIHLLSGRHRQLQDVDMQRKIREQFSPSWPHKTSELNIACTVNEVLHLETIVTMDFIDDITCTYCTSSL